VKGRTAKPKKGQLKEKFETKHLRYYATCRDPVFLFRVDPETGSGNWLFIQRYLKQKSVAEKLTKQGSMKVAFAPKCNFENHQPVPRQPRPKPKLGCVPYYESRPDGAIGHFRVRFFRHPRRMSQFLPPNQSRPEGALSR
jgi:hypothetical protein